MELDYVKLKELKPALSGYIRESLTLLKKSEIPDDDVVHDVRVLMKKSRATLKLMIPQLDQDYIMKDMMALREAGRILSSGRDTSVLRKLLKDFRKKNPAIFSQLIDNEKLSELLTKNEMLKELPAEPKVEIDRISELLTKTGYRIRFETMNKINPQLLLKQLEVSYNIVTEIYLKCRNNPKPDNFHEFRKKTKDFLYQLYFFRPVNSNAVKSLEKKLDNLTQNLGKFNDLSQLLNELDYKYPGKGNPPAMDELVIKIREKQDIYLAKVWPVAYKIFCPGINLVNMLGFRILVI